MLREDSCWAAHILAHTSDHMSNELFGDALMRSAGPAFGIADFRGFHLTVDRVVLENGTKQRCYGSNHRFQCALFTNVGGAAVSSIRSNSLRSTAFPLASSFCARFLVASKEERWLAA
jgi:hypothetical protein